MLVIISDLHLCDASSYTQNVTPAAFDLLYADIYSQAVRYHAENIDIVFLGDVFDLLRTERWFEDEVGQPVPLEERPWGYEGAITGEAPPDAMLVRARIILEGVIAKNVRELASLRGETVARNPPCPVRRIYIPGNHDRLYLLDDKLRARVRDVLGATDERTLSSEGIFQHRLVMPRYSLLARHGHEWDRINFQAFRDDATADDYSDHEYLACPMGDPLTTELIAALPYYLKRSLAETDEFKGTPELDRVRGRLEKVEDVRPLIATLRWPFYETARLRASLGDAQHSALRAHLRDAVRMLATNFLDLPYFQEWRDQCRDVGFGLLFEALRVIDPESLEPLDRALLPLASHFEMDSDLNNGAARENLDTVIDHGLRYVVYGHTHHALQLALRADGNHEDLYLNSGTWRRREFLTADRQGFIGWEQFTYLVFYDVNETTDGAKGLYPIYERWSGSRR